ncbi:MAG: flagellar assembly peptidoglycan hydrolase FlgJ [Thalassotalea sp.]
MSSTLGPSLNSQIGSSLDKAQNFFDLNSLGSITLKSKSTDEGAKAEALESAAKQFESIFMQMLLKSMRAAQDVLESDSPFNSETTKFYRDMHDQQLSVELSNNGSLGLSELIVRQLGGKQDDYKPNSIIRSDGNLPSFAPTTKAHAIDTSPSEMSITSINRQQSVPFKEIFQQVKTVNNFEQPQDFVTALMAPAKRAEKALGVPYQVVIAQAALETGWGKKVIKNNQGESSNNLFNIKADKRWQGDNIVKETLEFEQGTMVKKSAPFRVYDNITESVDDYINFLSKNPRYQQALDKASDVEQFLHGIQKAGYATDPMYATKIMGTLKRVASFISN